MSPEKGEIWVQKTTHEAMKAGLTFFRVSYEQLNLFRVNYEKLSDQSRYYLVEGWVKPPDDQGEPRWKGSDAYTSWVSAQKNITAP